MSETEVIQRLTYLEEHLEAGRDYAWWWWNGWTAFYSLGVVVESTRAGLANDRAPRADYVIGAVKAAAGTIVLLTRPDEAKNGADAVRALPNASLDDRRRRLVVAEELLRKNAEVSKRRYAWQRHVINAAVNGAGAVILWKGFDAPNRAWRSGVIGTGVGEASLWSQPWWPEQDWENYQRRFDSGATQPVSWRIAPTVGGLALHVDF